MSLLRHLSWISRSTCPISTWLFLIVWFCGRCLAQTQHFSLEYTGGLFGYYRIEEPDKDKRLEGNNEELKPVRDFLDKRGSLVKDKKNADDRLLLGMGDNFGPEFGAG